MKRTSTGFRRDPDFRIVIAGLLAILLAHILSGSKDQPAKQVVSSQASKAPASSTP
jgi:hypothetical protein